MTVPGSRVSTFLPASGGLPQAWNANDIYNFTISNSDRTVTRINNSNNGGARATTPHDAGNYYWECVATFNNASIWYIGFSTATEDLSEAPSSAGNWVYRADGRCFENGSVGGLFTAITSGDTIGVAINFTQQKIWIRINGTWVNSGNPAGNTGEVMSFIAIPGIKHAAARMSSVGSATSEWVANFGHTTFAHSAPSGFSAWG